MAVDRTELYRIIDMANEAVLAEQDRPNAQATILYLAGLVVGLMERIALLEGQTSAGYTYRRPSDVAPPKVRPPEIL